jgi:molecular chaperone GrpE
MQDHASPSGQLEADTASGVVDGDVTGELPEVAQPEGELETELATHVRQLHAALDAIARRLDSEAERAAARERVIDHLHAEVERLRSVERVGVMRPVIVDLCRLRDDLLRQASSLPTGLTTAQGAELLRSYADSVNESLERCGVEVLPTAVGTPFVPGQQQIAGVVEVSDPELDGTVVEVVRDGYVEVDGGKVVAPARIKLGRTSSVKESSSVK